MANGWQDDKRWSDKFLPEIKSILGMHLIGEPPIAEDAERNTDLMVLRMDAVRIACRVRKHQYAAPYPDDFTMRAGRPSGVKTELTKVVEGWGDYFFYGFCDPTESHLAGWMLGDLRVFRLWFVTALAGMKPGFAPGISKQNRDGSSSFRVFNVNELPPEFLVGRKALQAVAA